VGRGLTNLPAPFGYPSGPHVRRHGPQGYSKYRQYRNWLRDEFSFRCVYCLRRETWLTLRRDYEIDHFLPKSEHRDVELDEHGVTIIEVLRLDAPEYNRLRHQIIETVAGLQSRPRALKLWLGYPDDLPNLSTEKKPKDNKRLSGIRESHYERKLRGELPEYY
jgi:hypothetical protein